MRARLSRYWGTIVVAAASRESGWTRIAVNPESINGGFRSSCCTEDVTTNFLERDVALGAGDWNLQAIYAKDVDGEIMTFSIDGNDVGEIDGHGDRS
jgi:hypothetical protein